MYRAYLVIPEFVGILFEQHSWLHTSKHEDFILVSEMWNNLM